MDKKDKIKVIAINTVAILFIILLKQIAQLTNLPIYLFEPLRLFVILALIHTNKYNALALAILLPVLTYFFSTHTILLKVILIIVELIANIVLFYKINIRIKYPLIAMLFAILLSKLIFYLFQYILIFSNVILAKDVSHPIVPQIIVAVIISIYTRIFYKGKR